MRVMRSLVLMMSVLMLAGCAGVNSRFHCNAISPDRCMPLSQVNQLASHGYFSHHSLSSKVSLPHPFLQIHSNPNNTKPHYVGEATQAVWIAPFIDADNNYHEPETVYTVLSKGHWSGNPLSQIKTS